jgi:2-oxoglutarate ferredoxin oxidoreductase subunit alpha
MKTLMKGNEALAEAAIRAGCRFFSGYPITPQTEILEYMSHRMFEVGGEFVQTESEVAGINMLFGAAASGARALTTSSGPGFSLKQEGISYLAADDIPAVVVDVMRIGSGLGDIWPGQGDYWQLTRGGGNGDYRTIVLAPASVQECADLMVLAFDLAEKYKGPVLIASDAAIGQMAEAVKLPEFTEPNIDKFDWVIKSRKSGEEQRSIVNVFYKIGADNYPEYLRKRYQPIEENEQRYEVFATNGAEVIMVSYGISARICKETIKIASEEGIRLGLIRPITLWPFPDKAFKNLDKETKGILSVDMSILGQMVDDIKMSVKCSLPVLHYGDFANVPDPYDIINKAKELLRETR